MDTTTHDFDDDLSGTTTYKYDDLYNSSTVITNDLCSDDLPNIEEYVKDLNIYLITIIALGNILTVAIICQFANNIPTFRRNTPTKFIGKTLILNGIYPVVAISSSLTLWIPQAVLMSDTISNLAFFYCAFLFYTLLIDYIDGESNFIKTANNLAFSMKTPPCFCCCPFERKPVTKGKFLLTKWMILQLSFVHTTIYVVLNILYIEDKRYYMEFLLYFVPFIVVSIIVGVWGLNIAVRMIAPYFTEYNLKGKYFSLQFVLILCKMQPAFGLWVASYIKLECAYPFVYNIAVYRNATMQLLIILEMLVLQFLANKFYQKPTKR